MKITKYAHACLLVEEGNTRLVIDPGSWNETPDVTDVNAILITHEHQDHFMIDQIKTLLGRSPDAVIVTQEAVAAQLTDFGPKVVVLAEGETLDVNGVSIQRFGHDHAVIYGSVPCVNAGYLIAGKLFIPGDALHDVPNASVDVLALPTGGPWMKLGEAIAYVKAVRPRIAFPIHDAMHTEEYKRGFIPERMQGFLKDSGIEFRDLVEGETKEF